jgi:iron complex outermembrane recepter protein
VCAYRLQDLQHADVAPQRCLPGGRGHNVDASYSRGYRAGGFNYTATATEDFGPFDPEYVDAVEIGLKKDWQISASGRLRTNVALFRSHYRDIQRFVVPPNGILPTILNASTADIKGREVEILFRPMRALELGLNYAYTRPRYKDFITGQGDFSENEFAQMSKHQLSLNGRVTVVSGTETGDVRIRGDYYYQSRIFYTDTAQGDAFGPLETQSQKGYGIVNLGVDWQRFMGSRLDLNFFVNNVTQTKYRPFGIVVYQSIGYNAATIGDPRVFGLQGAVRF